MLLLGFDFELGCLWWDCSYLWGKRSVCIFICVLLLFKLLVAELIFTNRCDWSRVVVYYVMNFSGLQNMWDLTPDTDLLMELPEEYNFETALADLIVSLSNTVDKMTWLCVWSFLVIRSDTLLLIYQDNSLQAVWSNSKNDRRLIRYDITVVTIRLVHNLSLYH